MDTFQRILAAIGGGVVLFFVLYGIMYIAVPLYLRNAGEDSLARMALISVWFVRIGVVVGLVYLVAACLWIGKNLK